MRDGLPVPSSRFPVPAAVTRLRQTLQEAGALADVVAPRLGPVQSSTSGTLAADQTFLTMSSVLYDGVVVAGGQQSVATLRADQDAVQFVRDAYRHCKPVGALGDGVALLEAAGITPAADGAAGGVVTAGDGRRGAGFAEQFVTALGQHRFFLREQELLPV